VSPASPRSAGSTAAAGLLALALLLVVAVPPRFVRGETVPDHLVISEVVTGGSSASDELIELYNPTSTALPLEGLELVYVTASGATVSRRAAWELGAPTLGPGRHLLVANELGAYATIADALYASGMAATGGSVALRIQGAGSAIDAVGWGNAVSTWLEGQVATAPPAGSSLERRPGGAQGSTVDTDVNATDFLVRSVPEPQNTGSPPVPDPAATPSPSPISTASPPPSSPTPTADPTTTPSPQPGTIPVASARTLPDGTLAAVEGLALSSSDFTDGGGYVADGSAGIAVIVTGATFARGDHLRLSGTIDDRFSQRTLRVDAADLERIGTGAEPAPQLAVTGTVGENEEGELVRVAGDLTGAGTALTAGVAFDLDDGSGPTRLVVSTTTGIDTTAWETGTHLDLVGVVGQRDSTGSGSSGYRVQPRDPDDILAVSPPASPTPQPSGSGGPDPSGSPAPSGDVITIAAARELPKNARATVRGTVTLPTGVVDEPTAALQDATGAIVLRLGDEAGMLVRGDVVEVAGVRSTKSGMETLRVTTPAVRVGSGSEPVARELRTGDAGEAHEARLVVVRGAIVASPRRSSSGSVSFDIDDGSGPVKVAVAASLGMDGSSVAAGAWVEVTGVLGQDTTGAQPLRGYRVWPRDLSDVRVVATPTGASAQPNGAEGGAPGGAGTAAVGLDAVGADADTGLRIGATLVSAAWPEIGLGGLLWDGTRLAGLGPSAAAAIDAAIGDRRAPVALELSGLRATGVEEKLGLPLVRLGEAPDAILPASGPVSAPSTELPSEGDPPRWVAVVGRLEGRGSARTLRLPSGPLAVDLRCDTDASVPSGVIGLVGIATADPARIVVGCDGIRAAPALDRSGGGASPAAGRSGTARLAGLTGDGSGAGPTAPPIGAAALLGVAALALVGGAFVARRVGGDEPEPDGHDDVVGNAAEDDGSPPTLTLLPLPRERAP
jgi:hypothetical protein